RYPRTTTSLAPIYRATHRHHLLPSFFFNAPATTEIYTLSLHDALPISPRDAGQPPGRGPGCADGHARQPPGDASAGRAPGSGTRSEEHTSELQSRENLVCRLLLEKKKNTQSEA